MILASRVTPYAIAAAWLFGLVGAACSPGDDHRDQSYGTDVGAGYQQLPEASVPEVGDAADAGDAAAGDGADAADAADAATDGSATDGASDLTAEEAGTAAD